MDRRAAARRALPLTLLAAILAAPASAQPQTETPGAGLDLVVLVDRSASMSGAGRRVPSDPHGVRDLLLDLVPEVVARSAESNRVRHRLAVVSFGSAPRLDLPLSEVRAGEVDRLRRALAAVPSGSLGNTDLLAAFAAAARLLRNPQPAGPARRRAVLLLTDGVPWVPGFDALILGRQLRAQVAGDLLPRETALEVVVLPPRGRGFDRRLWRDLAGGRLVELSGDRGEAFAALDRIVAELVGVPAAESRPAAAGGASLETLVVPPYLDLVVFDIYREGPAAAEEVAVFAPDALRPLSAGLPGVEEVRLGKRLSSVTVRRPVPGQWTFRKPYPDTRVKIVAQQFFPRGVLLDPTSEPRLRQYDQVGVAYRLIDGAGAAVQELEGYPLALALSLVRPDGSRGALDMRRSESLGPGVFRTQGQAECDLAGRYWTEVQVTTCDLAGRQVEVFRDHWSGFSVEAARRIDCRVTPPGAREGRPAPAALAWLPWTRALATRLDCLDTRRRPVEMSAVVVGPPAGLFQPDLSREGRPISAALDLVYLGGGAYRGWLRGAGSPGSYRLRLAVDRSRLAVAYNVRVLPADTSFVSCLGWLDLSLALALAAAGSAALGWLDRRVRKGRVAASS
jgi:Mg-chelatase subunit ChlD